jgi:ADP-ribose pyrophosphatase
MTSLNKGKDQQMDLAGQRLLRPTPCLGSTLAVAECILPTRPNSGKCCVKGPHSVGAAARSCPDLKYNSVLRDAPHPPPFSMQATVFPTMPNSQQTLFETKRFTVVQEDVSRPDGRVAGCVYVKHPGAVAILPLLDDGRVCLIRSRRITVGKTLIEVPAGTREPGENPLDTARRELAEETGYQATHFDELAAYYPSPGVLSERMWVYVARGLTAGEPSREPNEEIENLLVTWDEALAMIDRGEIEDSKSLVAILLWERHRGRVG